MYATVRRYHGITDPAEAGRRVGEEFVPLLKKIPGFVAYYWIDAGNGVMASLTVYEDRTGEEASTETAATWVRDNAANLFPNPPELCERPRSVATSFAASQPSARRLPGE